MISVVNNLLLIILPIVCVYLVPKTTIARVHHLQRNTKVKWEFVFSFFFKLNYSNKLSSSCSFCCPIFKSFPKVCFKGHLKKKIKRTMQFMLLINTCLLLYKFHYNKFSALSTSDTHYDILNWKTLFRHNLGVIQKGRPVM